MTHHITHEFLPRSGDDEASQLVASLDNAHAFGHEIQRIRIIETHISWVILTGKLAYKIKKPVNFGFLDFSTLEKRHFYCEEELRLNRRYAPNVYLDVVKIRGSRAAPRLTGGGPVIEYAVKMRQFSQHALLSSLAERQELTPELIDAIAKVVGELHSESKPADPALEYGSPKIAARWCEENMMHIASAIPAQYLPTSFRELQAWYERSGELLETIQARKKGGFVRDCHGDLHLGNMALLDNQVTLFDCIEFEPELRWIDTVSEAAFVAMDLAERGYPDFCWRFINRYFETSDDYAGSGLLRYYFVYRALVRAKVEGLRADQEAGGTQPDARCFETALEYIELANRWASNQRPGMIVMHGLSGSGKSTVAAELVEAIGAFQVRSDIVRKRLFDLAVDARTDSAINEGIYSAEATEATYRRLQQIATSIIDAGFTVILDATFLEKVRRQQMFATQTHRPFRKLMISCDAPEAILRNRIVTRDGDPSEANVAVLEKQLRDHQPISEEEAKCVQIVNVGAEGLDLATIEKIEALLVNST